VIFICITCTLFAGPPSFVNTDPNTVTTAQRPQRPGGIQVGGGVIVNRRPYRGIDTQVIPIPFIMIESKKWSIKGPRFDYEIFDTRPWSMRALLRVRTENYDSDDSSFLRGMSDRDATLDAGLYFSYKQQWGVLGLDVLTDTLGKNKGQEIALRYTKPIFNPFGISDLMLRPFVGGTWRSTSLNDYYYGVRPNEARPNRPAYNCGDDFNVVAGIGCNYQLDEDWSVYGAFQNCWLGQEIRSSPIVDKNSFMSVIGGLVYRF